MWTPFPCLDQVLFVEFVIIIIMLLLLCSFMYCYVVGIRVRVLCNPSLTFSGPFFFELFFEMLWEGLGTFGFLKMTSSSTKKLHQHNHQQKTSFSPGNIRKLTGTYWRLNSRGRLNFQCELLSSGRNLWLGGVVEWTTISRNFARNYFKLPEFNLQ